MITIFKTARELQAFCDAQGWEFCFIGGVAVQRWTDGRVTRDVDLTLLAGFGNEDSFIDALLAQYTARNANPAQFARKNRVLLLQSESGIGIDISLGALRSKSWRSSMPRHSNSHPASNSAPARPRTRW